MKYFEQSNLGKEGFNWLIHHERKSGQLLKHVSPTLFIIKRNQECYSNRTGTNSQKLMNCTWNCTAYWLLLLACSAWFLTEDTSSGMALSKNWLSSGHQSLIKKIRLVCLKSDLLEAFSLFRFPPLRWLSLVSILHKTSQHRYIPRPIYSQLHSKELSLYLHICAALNLHQRCFFL